MSNPFGDLSIDSFENAIATLMRVTKEKPHHYILNYHVSFSSKPKGNGAIDKIQQAIKDAQPNQLLYRVDLRSIVHKEGQSQNWSLEACSMTKSLDTVGESPSA